MFDKIPNNLLEALHALDSELHTKDKEFFKNNEKGRMAIYHHSLGRALRNSWKLWHGSKLAEWFSAKGINHADDMSSIIIDSYWCTLHGIPLNLDKQIKFYQDYWANEELKMS